MVDAESDNQSDDGFRRFLRVVAIGVGLVAAYWVFTRFVAYTDDAFVRSDLIAIAPQVAGVVESVEVAENQRVTTGDPLMVIDPEPYRLAFALSKDEVAAADVEVKTREAEIKENTAKLAAAQADMKFADLEYQRYVKLKESETVSQATLDKAEDKLKSAKGVVDEAAAAIATAKSELDAARAAAQVARAQLAVDEYNLDQTRLYSPVDGYINNLTLRPGRYTGVGDQVIGIVDDTQWRIVANYKERIAGTVKSGTRVWIWLDSYPWHLFRGTVQGVGRGIARDTHREQLLPYIDPTTDWIRLQRRLPVTIHFDAPVPKEVLYMGADARVLYFR